MKRLFLTLVVALCSASTLSAQTTAREWLDGLSATLGERYALHINVSMPESETLNGYFMVENDSFYITLGAMEVFSNGKLRYEVNNDRKEVTEDRVDLTSRDLLSNPTRAFNFVDEEFEVRIAESIERGAVLVLKPRSGDAAISTVYMAVIADGSRVLPVMIIYDYEGDMVNIRLSMADVSTSTLPRWDKSAYRAYDIVSFL